jgi:hypothetical protein
MTEPKPQDEKTYAKRESWRERVARKEREAEEFRVVRAKLRGVLQALWNDLPEIEWKPVEVNGEIHQVAYPKGKWSDEEKMVALNLVAIELCDDWKALDAMLKELSKVKGLYRTKPADDDKVIQEKDKELKEDAMKIGQDFQKSLRERAALNVET